MPSPRRICIFCSGSGKSKEHVHSEWTHKIIPVAEGTTINRRLKTRKAVASGEVEQSERRTEIPQDLAHLQVHGTCGNCNQGWMSSLESAAMRPLGVMMCGGALRLSQEDQLTIARWMTLK